MNRQHQRQTPIPVSQAPKDLWHYLGFASFPAAENMALDLRMLKLVEQGRVRRPLLRFYRWDRPSISIGRNQDITEAISESEVHAHGYDIVTRPTGGRALLHKGDICYALAANRQWLPRFKSLTSTYRNISGALSNFLASLGVTLTESVGQEGRNHNPLAPCFAMLSPFEILVKGRKISGSAQFRSGDYFLQHGSIRIADNWNQSDYDHIWPHDVSLGRETVTSVEREIGRIPPDVELENDLLRAFQQHFGAICERILLSG